VACAGATSATKCNGPIVLSSRVSSRGGSVVAVAASTRAPSKRSTTVTKVETVASSSYSVASGHRARLTIRLNHTGRKLLNRFGKLPFTITFGGTAPLTKTFMLR
jgi:hypothetical protein